ncbi:hypothetical protein [uncultured Roseibium sp.]|uniref:hypothetical protein n=1 Tax=uncultured Roseibium sp. TaxID=1936171 RepID=UPI0026281A01|nr:hypothetical protein [uncultured Roseibium sp.]
MLKTLTTIMFLMTLSIVQARATVISRVELDLGAEEDLRQILGKKFLNCSADGIARVEFTQDHRVLYTKHPRFDLGSFVFEGDNPDRRVNEWFINGKQICEREVGARNENVLHCKAFSRAARTDYFFVEHFERGKSFKYSMQECSSPGFDCNCVSYNQF